MHGRHLSNIRNRDMLEQVRMAQGPDGEGFKPGHRATPSLYVSITAPLPADTPPGEGESQVEELLEAESKRGESDALKDGDGTSSVPAEGTG